MVHEAALWKWPGRETASDIRSQGKLMDLLQTLYLNKLVEHSKDMSFDDWVRMEEKTSWFSAETAMEIGILDYID
jgi:ATP-dependent protease ClpP protease subunit